ncbi:DUF378 domain-containing protein [Bauldia sp.]|uniref:DUF378 domain-containing protein n=1 Tax=Bauldia sp. TaxID=2575872 RepID=UPI003BA9CE8F
MKAIDIVTLILIIVGGINWGLIGLFGFNLVEAIFGAGTVLTTIIYIVVGLSALWQLIPLGRSFSSET